MLEDLHLAFCLDSIEKDLKEHGEASVQFDRPFGDVFHILTGQAGEDFENLPTIGRDEYLSRLRKLCVEWGDRLTVRFYAHYYELFDGKVLLDLPEIQSLMVNSLKDAVTNLECIGELPNLKKLHIGVYELENKKLLDAIPVSNLTDLTLEEARTKALDLSALKNAQSLKRLRIFGHKKNIEAVGGLSGLEDFSFNPMKGMTFDFLQNMTSLKSLKFVLGGVESIESLGEMPTVEDMAFTMVRGLSELGDLQRFPSLERFFMQDQPQVTDIKFGASNAALKHVWLYNCPKLSSLGDLSKTPNLESLHAVKTDLSLKGLSPPNRSRISASIPGRQVRKRKKRLPLKSLAIFQKPAPKCPSSINSPIQAQDDIAGSAC